MKKLHMLGSKRIQHLLGMGGLLVATALATQGAVLTPGEPILLENTKGGFDFIRIDTNRNRLLLAHTGNKTFDVFDLLAKRLLKSLPTGAAQDSAVDEKNGRYYVTVSVPPKMAIIDANQLEITGEVKLPAAADLTTFNPLNGKVYVCNDTAPELWVIDPQAKQILNTITVKGKGMEGLTFDLQYKKLFQAVKTGNFLVVIDPSDNKVLETWTTAPATNPHGIALVPEADTLLVAGGSGALALLNPSTGKVLAHAEIAQRVDEMAYDSELHLAYCGSSQAKISVVRLEGGKLTALGDELTQGGAKSIAVDPKTHVVWIAYAKVNQSFVQPFTVHR